MNSKTRFTPWKARALTTSRGSGMQFLRCKIGRDYLNFAARCASIKPMLVTRSRRIFQATISVVAIVTLFAITNHCALGAVMTSRSQTTTVQTHCHGDQSSPAQKGSDEETPCCKLLRATITSNAKALQPANENFLGVQSWAMAEIRFTDETRLHNAVQQLGTGPPSVSSFAESVLQRSILAHAPPPFLS